MLVYSILLSEKKESTGNILLPRTLRQSVEAIPVSERGVREERVWKRIVAVLPGGWDLSWRRPGVRSDLGISGDFLRWRHSMAAAFLFWCTSFWR